MGTVTGGHNVMGAAGPQPVWYFPDGSTAAGWDTYLTLMNPAGQDSQIRLTYYVVGEPVPRSKEIIAPKNARTTVAVHELGQGVGRQHALGIKVETLNGVNIVVERPIYFRYAPSIDGGHAVMGATTPAARWLFAEGYTGAGFDQYLVILNPNAFPADVTVTYYLSTGSPIIRSLTVPELSRATVVVFDVGEVGRGKEVSTAVETSHPGGVVAERPIYFSYLGTRDGGHTVMGHPAEGGGLAPFLPPAPQPSKWAEILLPNAWWHPGDTARLYDFNRDGTGTFWIYPGGRGSLERVGPMFLWTLDGDQLRIVYGSGFNQVVERTRLISYDANTDVIMHQGELANDNPFFGCRAGLMPFAASLKCGFANR
jgi:hypothetical protein